MTTNYDIDDVTADHFLFTGVTCRRDLSIAVAVTFILTFLLTVLFSTVINFILYSMCNRHQKGNKKEFIDLFRS